MDSANLLEICLGFYALTSRWANVTRASAVSEDRDAGRAESQGWDRQACAPIRARTGRTVPCKHWRRLRFRVRVVANHWQEKEELLHKRKR